MHDSLGHRMKSNYEHRNRSYLIRRMPVIMRIDGKCFHTFTQTQNFIKPFSEDLNFLMTQTAIELYKQIQGAKCIYTQSDEINILITDYDTIHTDAWFDYNVQKMCSIGASIATSTFNKHYIAFEYKDMNLQNLILANFDCRVFNLPREEVCNYFIWRQQDWVRNSLQMLARNYFSHKELHHKNVQEINEMLHSVGVNWTSLPDKWKNGVFIYNSDNTVEENCPIFNSVYGRTLIDSLLKEKE